LKDKADYYLDFRGQITSMSLLELTELFREMGVGDVVEIVAEERQIVADIFKVLPAIFYELLDMEEQDDVHRIQIKKIKKYKAQNK